MPKMSFKILLVAGLGLVVTSVISGYFFSIGADLWQATKEQVGFLPPIGLFWFVSVPIGIVGIGLLAYAAWYSKRKPERLEPKHPIDLRFAHLTVHYSQRTDTPDTSTPSRPRFVTHNNSKQAYWVSDLIEADLRAHKIPWHTHESEKALREYLRKNKFNINERDPTSNELGLIDMSRQKERMRLVYAPLHSAVVSMREGKPDLRKGFTLGTPINAWTRYPEIMRQVVDIFTKYADLVENEKVWNGWTRKEPELRKGTFWLGGEVYEWFDAIQDEYNKINSEMKIAKGSS